MITTTQNSATSNERYYISRKHRSAFMLLLDASGSMMETIEHEDGVRSKCEVLADAANNILSELYLRSWHSSEVRDYFDVAVLIYSGSGIFSLFGDENKPFVPMVSLHPSGKGHKRFIRFSAATKLFSAEDITLGGEHHKLIIPEGETPMYEVLHEAFRALKNWCYDPAHLEYVPATVINISDGMATDAPLDMLLDISAKIKQLSTPRGETLLVNILLGNDAPYIFPTDEELRAEYSPYISTMALSSSVLPEYFVPLVASLREVSAPYAYRAFGSAANASELLSMMSIGTHSLPSF